MTGLVRLVPPYSRSGPSGHGFASGHIPLTAAPPLLRSRGMGRWHRPQSGYSLLGGLTGSRRISVSLWCGQHVRLHEALHRAALPDGEPLCGTCEGRAVGAGQPATGDPIPALIHQPHALAPAPPWCPTGRLHESATRHLPYGTAFPCPACGAGTRMRAAGRGYDHYVKIEGHLTGPDLVDACPFHRWDHLVLTASTATCACRIPQEVAA